MKTESEIQNEKWMEFDRRMTVLENRIESFEKEIDEQIELLQRFAKNQVEINALLGE